MRLSIKQRRLLLGLFHLGPIESPAGRALRDLAELLDVEAAEISSAVIALERRTPPP